MIVANALYLGSTAIDRIYLGDVLVWEGDDPEPPGDT